MMSSVSGKRTREDNDSGTYFSDKRTSQKDINEIKKRKKEQNKIRCRRYRERKKQTDAIVSSQIYKHQTITVEEEEKIKLRKEYDKQKSQRYRDKKRAVKLINIHNSQISGPSTINVPYVTPTHTADLSTWNEPCIPESHSDNEDDIYNDTPSQVNYVPQLHEPIITIYVPNTQNILPCDVQNNSELKMFSEVGKRKNQDNDDGADFSDDAMSQIEIDEIKKRRKDQNKIRCRRYRDRKKKKNDALLSSEIYKHRTITAEEEEKIKCRKEYDKQKSQRYRDKKRAANLIKLQKNCSQKQM